MTRGRGMVTLTTEGFPGEECTKPPLTKAFDILQATEHRKLLCLDVKTRTLALEFGEHVRSSSSFFEIVDCIDQQKEGRAGMPEK
jgi:hypothetical protein